MKIAKSIRARLDAGKVVDRSLPGGGHVHIERPQPFLCIYREGVEGADLGTRELIAVQPSYLVLPADYAGCAEIAEALAATIEALAEMFGAMLIVELFALPLPEDYVPEEGPPRPLFEILAPQRGAPVKTIEALEGALLEQAWPGGEPAIRAVYKRHRAPESLAPIVPAKLRKRADVTDIALGIRAIYRDHEGKAVLPMALREVRRSLTTALRQGFYEFSHTQARYRPAHYHELGAQTIEGIVWDVDQALAEVGDSFDLILDSTPVNSSWAWYQFRSSRYEREPEFHYRPLRHDPGTLKRKLYAAPLEEVGDPALHALLADKREELDNQIELLANRGTRRFLYGSLQVYGAPDESLLALAKDITATIPPRAREKRDTDQLDSRAFAEIAREELDHYRKVFPQLEAKVEVRDDVPGLIVSNGHFLIGEKATVSKSRAPATIAHEIGTHILTFYNGLAQPFRQLHTGLAGYEALQEGIAVLAEYLVGGLSRPRLRLLAGRVLAVASLVGGADFVETVRLLRADHGFSHRQSYTIAMRVHRSGGLTKDMVYLKGLNDLLRVLGETDLPFEDLLVGKFALDHVHLVEELRWRKILKPPVLLPRYLRDESARKRLDGLRETLSPIDLIERQEQ